jgi:hypothetical protein
VISLLNRYFVPVYVSNEDYNGSGAAPADERKVYLQIYHEAIEQKRSNGTVCVYLVAPDGKGFDSLVVSKAAEPGNLQKLLESAISRLKTKEGKPLIKPVPQAAPPRAAAGELVLHLVSRYDHRGSWAEFPAENYIVLKQSEWKKLLPPEGAKVGTTYDINKDLATKMLTYFFPQTEMCDCALMTSAEGPYKHRIENASLRGRVIEGEGKIARVRLEGRVKLKHKFYPGHEDDNHVEASVLGLIEIDPSGKKAPVLRLLTDQAVYAKQKFTVALRSLP